jgi:hypothetical protein
MKKCVCGQLVAANARTCPHCENRFTHPLVMALAWFFGICIGLSFILAIFSSSPDSSKRNTPSNIPPTAQTTAQAPTPFQAIKSTYDQAAFVIQHCGRPDRDFLEKAPDTTIRHLVYRKFNTELFFYRGADMPKWVLGNAFLANQDEALTMKEANQRMPCAKGELHSMLGID